jgi:hypothetical protein
VLLLFRRTLEKNMKSIGRHRQHRVTP